MISAIRNGNFEGVKRAVKENPNCVQIKDDDEWSPLDVAIARGKLKMAKYLWKMGGRPNLKNYRDGENTPMHSVAQKDILEWVFENKVLPLRVLNSKDCYRWTPLDEAISRGKLETAKFIWEMGGRPNLEHYRDGKWTSVHEAAYYGKTTTLKWVFAKGVLPLDMLNIKNQYDRTPLDESFRCNRTAALLRRLIHLDPVFLAMHRAKRDRQCVLRRLPDELLDMIVDVVGARHGLKVVW